MANCTFNGRKECDCPLIEISKAIGQKTEFQYMMLVTALINQVSTHGGFISQDQINHLQNMENIDRQQIAAEIATIFSANNIDVSKICHHPPKKMPRVRRG
jgi:hypothetical protein